jgi:hypothetical protein
MVFARRNLASNTFIIVTKMLVAFSIVSNTVDRTSAQSSLVEQARTVKQALRAKGYWIDSVDATIDESFYYSIMSLQRTSPAKTMKPAQSQLDRILESRTIVPKSTPGFHIEVNLALRVLYFVSDDGTVDHILPIAVGRNSMFLHNGRRRVARTPKGTFTITRKINGWRRTELGNMYYPNYFLGGFAIHGSKRLTVSSYTFGCIGIPEFAAPVFSQLVPIGTKVLIF